MNLTDPTMAVTSSLDATVLATLAASGSPLTVTQVGRLAARGSEVGLRRSLGRLVEQGIVERTQVSRSQVYGLNRDHVAATIAQALADLPGLLVSRLMGTLEEWAVPPVHAALFGSAARRDGDEASDIDLLLVHPLFPAERLPDDPRIADAATAPIATTTLRAQQVNAAETWHRQVDRLRTDVYRWTGNDLQVVDLSVGEFVEPTPSLGKLLREAARDGVVLRDHPALATMRLR